MVGWEAKKRCEKSYFWLTFPSDFSSIFAQNSPIFTEDKK
jgi:hypothetical protein